MCATPVAYGGKPHNSLFQTRFGDEPCRAAQESHDFNRGRCQDIDYDLDDGNRIMVDDSLYDAALDAFDEYDIEYEEV